MPSNKIGSTKT